MKLNSLKARIADLEAELATPSSTDRDARSEAAAVVRDPELSRRIDALAGRCEVLGIAYGSPEFFACGELREEAGDIAVKLALKMNEAASPSGGRDARGDANLAHELARDRRTRPMMEELAERATEAKVGRQGEGSGKRSSGG